MYFTVLGFVDYNGWEKLIFTAALFPSPPPHLTYGSILWCNAWFYKVDYEDQICLSCPNQSVCQILYQSDNLNRKMTLKILQVGGGERKKSLYSFYCPYVFEEKKSCQKYNIFWLFSSSPPLSKYRVLCLIYVLLRLNA